jgi:hypothetical protein
MTRQLDHEACSTLLKPYVEGALDEDSAEAVARHLGGCDRCRSEHDAVGALLALEVAALTTDERARLRNRVRAESARPADVVPLPTRSRARALLGAAAAVLVLAAGGFYFGGATGGGGAGSAGGGALESPRQRFERARAPAGTDTGGKSTLSRGPAPRFDRVARLGDDSLKRLGSTAPPLTAFARAYRAADVPALKDRLLTDLERAAPARAREQIRRCAGAVLDRYTALPAYAAVGRLGERRVLVTGFAWTDGGTRLRRFQMWAWPRGSCASPVAYEAGRIAP